jgi:uncharacterized RDD family membrane protein YckC
LAWLVDLGLAHAAQQLIYGILGATAVEEFWRQHRLGFGLLALAGGSVPLFGSYLQSRWKTTPGKRLFQLRIVDRHGLAPAPSVLAVRAAFQLLPFWAATAWYCLTAIGLRPLGVLLAGVAAIAVLVDGVTAVFGRAGRCLHDRLLGTQVVLDTLPRP